MPNNNRTTLTLVLVKVNTEVMSQVEDRLKHEVRDPGYMDFFSGEELAVLCEVEDKARDEVDGVWDLVYDQIARQV